MINKNYKIVAVITAVSLLTGCWDSLDIEKHDIVITVIIDHRENQYGFFVEIPSIIGNSGGGTDSGGQSSKTRFAILNAQGDSLIAARDELNRRSDQPIYLGAARAVVFTDSCAKFGVEEYLNRMRGDIYYRKPIFLITTSTEPEKLLMSKPENSPSVGSAIENTLDSLNKEKTSCSVTAGQVLEAMAVKTVGFFLPDINLEKGETTLTGYSVFKDAKKIGTIDAKERKGLVLLTCQKVNLLYIIQYKGREITINTMMVKRKIKAFFQDGKARFSSDFYIDASIEYMDKMERFTKEEQEAIMTLLQSKIKEDIQKTIEVSQEKYQCDYLKFYKYFRALEPKVFQTMNWNTVYSQAQINVSVKARLIETGLLEIINK